jgi:hypothetical protein
LSNLVLCRTFDNKFYGKCDKEIIKGSNFRIVGAKYKFANLHIRLFATKLNYTLFATKSKCVQDIL